MTRIQKKISESEFEKHIENVLVSMHGYASRKNEKYNQALAMDTELV